MSKVCDTSTSSCVDCLGTDKRCGAGDTPETCAEITAAEIARLIAERTTIRDKDTGVRRAVTELVDLLEKELTVLAAP